MNLREKAIEIQIQSMKLRDKIINGKEPQGMTANCLDTLTDTILAKLEIAIERTEEANK